MNILDIGRALGREPEKATVKSVKDWLLSDYLVDSGGGFNYDSAIACLPGQVSGKLSLSGAKAFCEAHGAPAGRAQNVKVVSAVDVVVPEYRSRCHRIGFQAVQIGRARSGQELFATIKTPVVRVAGNRPYIVWVGFRAGHAPTRNELGIGFSLVRHEIAIGDLAYAGIEYWGAPKVPEGSREIEIVDETLARHFSRPDLNAVLSVFIEAVSDLLDEGHGVGAPRLSGYRIIDPRQADAFKKRD